MEESRLGPGQGSEPERDMLVGQLSFLQQTLRLKLQDLDTGQVGNWCSPTDVVIARCGDQPDASQHITPDQPVS